MIKVAPRASYMALAAALVLSMLSTAAEATPIPVAGSAGRQTVGLPEAAPSVAMGGATLGRQTVRAVGRLKARYSRADFMEDTPREIYLENRANPWQAWALAFFPTAIIKGITLGLAFAKAGTDQWAVFLPLIPSMGLSHFWETKFVWAGLIALAGDIAGSSLVTVYWSDYYQSTAATRPAQTMLWAGIGVLAVAWIYEMVTAPLFAKWRNSKLRKQFMPSEPKADVTGPSWRVSPWPTQGLAQLGPPINQPVPITAGYSFKF